MLASVLIFMVPTTSGFIAGVVLYRRKRFVRAYRAMAWRLTLVSGIIPLVLLSAVIIANVRWLTLQGPAEWFGFGLGFLLLIGARVIGTFIFACVGGYFATRYHIVYSRAIMPRIRRRTASLTIADIAGWPLLVVAISVAWTVLIADLTGFIPEIDVTHAEFLQQEVGIRYGANLQLVVVLASMVIYEEIVYRMGMQGLLLPLFRGRTWAAVLAASIIFTFAHYDPQIGTILYRYIQIFPLGLALGVLYFRRGIESAIIAHAVFNAAVFLIY